MPSQRGLPSRLPSAARDFLDRSNNRGEGSEVKEVFKSGTSGTWSQGGEDGKGGGFEDNDRHRSLEEAAVSAGLHCQSRASLKAEAEPSRALSIPKPSPPC